jgi:molybdopterin molybdotransferase
VLEFEKARQVVLDAVRPLAVAVETETVPIEDAHGRILQQDVLADRNYPALRRSLRDGFAIKSSNVPGILRVRGEVRAGDENQDALHAGEALEIMTGAPVPEGADAVVMIEHVKRDGSTVKIDRTAESGQFINEAGAEARLSSILIHAATRIDASHIATLAMTGATTVPVAKRPTVAILATGDEIVSIEEKPAAHQIRNSNSYMLSALVRAAGGIPTILPVARDRVELLRPLLEKGLAYDLLVISGGVSAGKYDLVKPTLRDLGAEFQFERVKIQPGQPTAFGLCRGKPVFGLPGNPGSSLITFELFAKLALQLLCGEREPVLELFTATFAAPFRHKLGLTRFLPARLSADGEHLRHIPWQGSSDIPALAKANVFLVADHDREAWNVGEQIRVLRKP